MSVDHESRDLAGVFGSDDRFTFLKNVLVPRVLILGPPASGKTTLVSIIIIIIIKCTYFHVSYFLMQHHNDSVLDIFHTSNL